MSKASEYKQKYDKAFELNKKASEAFRELELGQPEFNVMSGQDSIRVAYVTSEGELALGTVTPLRAVTVSVDEALRYARWIIETFGEENDRQKSIKFESPILNDDIVIAEWTNEEIIKEPDGSYTRKWYSITKPPGDSRIKLPEGIEVKDDRQKAES
jgi:hypothetical protein